MCTYPVSDIYKPDKAAEAVNVFGADDSAHPAVHYLHNSAQEFYVGGSVQAIAVPQHFDYVALRCELILGSLERCMGGAGRCACSLSLCRLGTTSRMHIRVEHTGYKLNFSCRHPGRAPRLLHQAVLEEGRRLPDPVCLLRSPS